MLVQAVSNGYHGGGVASGSFIVQLNDTNQASLATTFKFTQVTAAANPSANICELFNRVYVWFKKVAQVVSLYLSGNASRAMQFTV